MKVRRVASHDRETPMTITFAHARFQDLSLLDLHDILWLRNEVFVVGQKITVEPEVDGQDPACVHVWGRDAYGNCVATARVFLDCDPVKVGRVAVATGLQRSGVGSALMAAVHTVIGPRDAALSAQAYLETWYRRLGWTSVGERYDEAEIPHIWMVRLAPAGGPGAPSSKLNNS
jgi:ElaA protein